MTELSSNMKRPVVICGPSGCGKSTCIRNLIARFPNSFRYCVSHTTRPSRADEIHGRDYYFVSTEQFRLAIDNQEFIEYAMFSGHFYGTSKEEFHKAEQEQSVCLMDVDIQGVEKLQKSSYNPICIFIRPRSFAILEKRLRSRSTETEDRILQRLAVAHQEMQYGISEGKFDAVIVNDDIDRMVEQVVDLLDKLSQLN